MYTLKEFENILAQLTPGCTGSWKYMDNPRLSWKVNADKTIAFSGNADKQWPILDIGKNFYMYFSNIHFPDGTPILPIELSVKDRVKNKIDLLWKRSEYYKTNISLTTAK